MFLSITLHIAEVLEILAMMFLYLPAVISTGKNVVVNMYVMRAAEKQYGIFFYCGQQLKPIPTTLLISDELFIKSYVNKPRNK